MWRFGKVALATLAILALAVPAFGATDDRKPNLVLVLADDLGWGELGCYGQRRIETPRIDRMAAEGVRFTQHYAGSAVCAPSRCVLLTGLHTGHAFVRDNREIRPEGQEPIPDATLTVAEVLKEAGYATAAIGKWGLGGPGSEGEPNRQGFDHFFGYLCQRLAHDHYPSYLWRNAERVETGAPYSHDLFTEEALEFVRRNRERPFFLYLAYAVPHLAIQVPEDSLAPYRGRWEDPPYEGGKGYRPHPTPRAAYAAMVSRLDRDVGRLLDLLRDLGLERDTLVLLSSDNGPTHGGVGGSDSEFFESAGPLRGLKGSLHEGGIRVPLVARWPGRIAAGRTTDHPSAFWDAMPTLLEVAGIEPPAAIDGISYAPTLFASGAQRAHAFLYWEFPGYGGQQAVRLGDWKGIRRGMNDGNLDLELYDLASDPSESRDLARERPGIVRRIREIMERERRPSPEFPLRPLDSPK